MSIETTREMLFNYFNNKATTLEKRRIDEWAKEPANIELFYEYLAQWESQNLQYVSDVDAAIEHYHQRQEAIPLPVKGEHESSSARRIFIRWSIAVSVLALLVTSTYFSKDFLLYRTIATSYGQTEPVLLMDGTRVILNANSSLMVPRFGFGDYTREVSLKGEANFRVTHLPGNQKFVVKTTNGPDVVVLGTEFTVYTRNHGTKVVLSKGKIQLNYRENETNKNLIMLPGELVTIDVKGKADVKKTADPEIFSAWKDHRYVFEHTSLRDLCILFDEDFGLKVSTADPDILDWTVSGTFLASDAEELMEALAESSGLVYKMENQKVIIHAITNKSNP